MTRGLDALAVECRAALVAGARTEGASRQRARASARRFVRRHRRDASYLLWVLRGVAASSALAVALLGLDARPASADAPLFGISATLPVNFIGDSGDRSYPAFGDLDGDGDLDVVVGD